MPAKVVGRPQDGHGNVRPDPHRDHVPGDLAAQPDACVEAIRHHIGQAVIEGDLDRERNRTMTRISFTNSNNPAITMAAVVHLPKASTRPGHGLPSSCRIPAAG